MTASKIWVGNAEYWNTEEDLIEDVEKTTGIRAKGARFGLDHQTGRKKNFAFVEYENQNEAAEALRLLDKTIIPSSGVKRFMVNWGSENKPKNDIEMLQKADGYVCYVGNLPSYIDDNKLLEYFRSSFPDVINARIIYNGNASKGYGFVKFNTHNEVIEAIKKFNNSKDFGHSLRVCEGAKNRIDNPDEAIDSKNTTLFVTDIDPAIVNEEILRTNFSVYGEVVSIKIDEEKPSWVTINMDSHETAESAKNALQGARFGGTTKCVINWGKNIEEMSAPKIQRIVVPNVNSKKQAKIARAEFFDSKNVHKIIDYIQHNAEMQRSYPLPGAVPEKANHQYEQSRISTQFMFEQHHFSNQLPESQSLWYY